MYLSQLLLNPAEAHVRRDLANPYELHRTIMGAFPTPLPQEERVLFRIETNHNSARSIVLIQSVTQPNWEKVQQKNKDYFARFPEVRSLDNLNIKAGARLRFRLRANPSKRVYYAKKEKSQRISLFSEKDRLEWILGKAEGGGFSVSAEDLLVCDAPYRTMFIAHGDKKHKATINMVDYDGVLQVVNADNFLLCMHQGIGPAKGLGCGLLSVARI